MSGYKDRTWCVSSYLCANTECDRNLSEEEVQQAIKWWGGLDFPYAVGDIKTEGCGFQPRELKELTNE